MLCHDFITLAIADILKAQFTFMLLRKKLAHAQDLGADMAILCLEAPRRRLLANYHLQIKHSHYCH